MKPFSPLTPRLRNATEADCDELLRLRNLPEVCRYSGDPKAIEEEDHRRWFAATIHSPDHIILMIELADSLADSEVIGSIRLDQLNDGYRISIFIHPEYHGRGIGKWALLAAENHVPGGKRQALHAAIHPENTASIRLFEAAEYLPDPGTTVPPPFLSYAKALTNRITVA
jgi:UDP-2,4-diacetamido-2,4,6-trideoxy-beta-L-altropyranose hydrolase